jgi:ribosomal protein S19E (S16A)
MGEYETVIVRGLYSAGQVGERYTNMKTLMRYFPRRNRDMTLIKKAVKSLRKKGMLELHKKGDCVSLSRSRKILARIEKEYILK